MKNQDKKQKRLDDAKKKIPGRGYRTPVPTPLTLPYELERNYYSKNLACTWNEEYGGLYIGESKYAKKVLDNGKIVGKKRRNAAFVKPHKQGFIFIQQNLSGNKSYKKTIIPGELGLAKTLDILAEKIIPIKRAYDDLEILKLHKNKKDPDKEINNFFLIARLNFEKNNTNLYKEVSRKARKLEIAAALLANGIWQKRGFVDKEKIAPKGFWHKITPEEACKGDKRSMQKWWLDALYREAIDMPIALLYLEEKKKERNIAMRENARLVNNNDKYVNVDGNEYLIKRDGVDDAILKAKMDKDNDKNYQMRGLTQRASLLVPIKKAIEEGKLPNYPWEIRNWDKLKFSLYKKSLLFGIHNAKN